MKRKGSTSDFTADRNKELREKFFSQKVYSTTDTALMKTLKTPSTRFWVDPDRARDVLSSIKKNPAVLNKMYPERQRMYKALMSKYEEIQQRHPDKSRVECVAMAIYSGAPEFFLTPSAARNILYN
ncbi:MAG: hypothetical protein NC095_11270 [Muribaculum sp.]|nr:hypothetical protein [Muribaculum sp.]